MRYTLDTNCLITLDEDREFAPKIRHLIANEPVCVAGIAASERQRSGKDLSNFGLFQDRLNRLGLSNAEVLRPPAYVRICYADWCLVHCDEFDRLERRIHAVLFPAIPFDAQECMRANGPGWERWCNAKCDVLTVWCHIHYTCDVFVTDDGNFQKKGKTQGLAQLGCKMIVKPSEL